jgi:hypothetical protein
MYTVTLWFEIMLVAPERASVNDGYQRQASSRHVIPLMNSSKRMSSAGLAAERSHVGVGTDRALTAY